MFGHAISTFSAHNFIKFKVNILLDVDKNWRKLSLGVYGTTGGTAISYILHYFCYTNILYICIYF